MFKVIGATPEEQRWPVMFGARLEIIEKLFAKNPKFEGLAKIAKSIIEDIKHLLILRDMLVHGTVVRYEPKKDAVVWRRIDRSPKQQQPRDPAITHMRKMMLVRYSMLAGAADGCFSVNSALLNLRENVKALGVAAEK